jgi:hypothetical protein
MSFLKLPLEKKIDSKPFDHYWFFEVVMATFLDFRSRTKAATKKIANPNSQRAANE